jgi:hypothetical protein
LNVNGFFGGGGAQLDLCITRCLKPQSQAANSNRNRHI